MDSVQFGLDYSSGIIQQINIEASAVMKVILMHVYYSELPPPLPFDRDFKGEKANS